MIQTPIHFRRVSLINFPNIHKSQICTSLQMLTWSSFVCWYIWLCCAFWGCLRVRAGISVRLRPQVQSFNATVDFLYAMVRIYTPNNNYATCLVCKWNASAMVSPWERGTWESGHPTKCLNTHIQQIDISVCIQHNRVFCTLLGPLPSLAYRLEVETDLPEVDTGVMNVIKRKCMAQDRAIIVIEKLRHQYLCRCHT